MVCCGFEVTCEDIEIVLHNFSRHVINPENQSFEEMAFRLIDQLDHPRIEKAALSSSTELDEQTAHAYEEIAISLTEMGVLVFK